MDLPAAAELLFQSAAQVQVMSGGGKEKKKKTDGGRRAGHIQNE